MRRPVCVGDCGQDAMAVDNGADDASVQYARRRRRVLLARVPGTDGLVAGPETLDMQSRGIRWRTAPAVVSL